MAKQEKPFIPIAGFKRKVVPFFLAEVASIL
jgi:hypothetical protein